MKNLGFRVIADSFGIAPTRRTNGIVGKPIIIGYIVQGTGSFNGALVFVGANALGAILSYLLIVGEIKRMELKHVSAGTVAEA